MKFARYMHVSATSVFSARRVAAAEKSIAADRERNALTPELVRYHTAEERLSTMEAAHVAFWKNMRDHTARNWREARFILRTLPRLTQLGVLRHWDESWCPKDAVYFLEYVREVAAGKRLPWRDLRERRQLVLIGQGKLPKRLMLKERNAA